MAKMARKKIYAILRGREGVLNDVEVFNTNQEEAWVIFRKIYENQPGILSGARITFQSQPYYYASNGAVAPGGPTPEDKQPDRSRYASPIKIVIFKHKNNPRLVITVKAYPNMSIAEIENPFNVRFPYFVGQVLNMGHRTWACNNGYLVNDEDPCPEKKIFGMRAKDIPQGHPLRHLYPGKFRVDGGIAANGAEVDAGLERVKEIQKKHNYSVLDLRRKDRWSDDRYNGQGSKKPIAETDIIVRTNKSFYSIIDSPPSSATKESVEDLRKLIGTQVNNGTLVDVIATIRGYYDNPTYSAGPYVEYFYVLDSPRSNDSGGYAFKDATRTDMISAKEFFKGKKVVDSVDKDSILGYVIKKVMGERAFMQDGGGIGQTRKWAKNKYTTGQSGGNGDIYVYDYEERKVVQTGFATRNDAKKRAEILQSNYDKLFPVSVDVDYMQKFPTKFIKKETFRGNTMEDVFKLFDKENNSLRYTTSYYRFSLPKHSEEYNKWYNSLSESERFDMYYGSGIVD